MQTNLTETLRPFCATPADMVPITVDRRDVLSVFYVEGRECGLEPNEFVERLVLNYPLLFADADLAAMAAAVEAAV